MTIYHTVFILITIVEKVSVNQQNKFWNFKSHAEKQYHIIICMQ